MRLPTARGTWAAVWLLSEHAADPANGAWPETGEIDIVEHVGYDAGRIHGTVHTDAFNHKRQTEKTGSVSGVHVHEWHTYSVDWDDTHIIWALDGVEFFRLTRQGHYGPLTRASSSSSSTSLSAGIGEAEKGWTGGHLRARDR